MDPRFGPALFWLEASLRHKNLLKEAVALRLAIYPPERGESIERTFKSAGFQGVLREDGEMFKNSGELISAARCFAQIGEKNEALGLLEACYAHRCSSMATLKAEPDFDALQSETRFQNLLQRLALLEESAPFNNK
jgi:hypothetical protein